MDQEEIKNSIIERFNNLQPEIQMAIMDTDYEKNVYEIGKKYNLNNKQLGELELNTTLVMLGQIHPDDYENELADDIEFPKDIIKEMVKEVNEKILKSIIDLLRNNFEEDNRVDFEFTNTPTPPYIKTKTVESQKITNFIDPIFTNLPKNLQEVIALSDWKSKLYAIAGKYKLKVEQMGILEEITIKLILGEIHPEQYERELASKLTIGGDDLSNLIKDVNENILKKIREGEKIITNDQLLITNEDKIPLPPYKAITNDKLPITNVKEETKPIIPTEDEVPLPPPDRKPITNEATKENKPIVGISDTPLNTIEEKLKGATVSDQTVSNHSLPKINDPYREAF